jgi:hypothetical protein
MGTSFAHMKGERGEIAMNFFPLVLSLLSIVSAQAGSKSDFDLLEPADNAMSPRYQALGGIFEAGAGAVTLMFKDSFDENIKSYTTKEFDALRKLAPDEAVAFESSFRNLKELRQYYGVDAGKSLRDLPPAHLNWLRKNELVVRENRAKLATAIARRLNVEKRMTVPQFVRSTVRKAKIASMAAGVMSVTLFLDGAIRVYAVRHDIEPGAFAMAGLASSIAKDIRAREVMVSAKNPTLDAGPQPASSSKREIAGDAR